MDPKKRFFRFAFPCASNLKEQGKISDDAYYLLCSIADNEAIAPEEDLLAQCFPTAFANLGKLAEQHGRNRWDSENVKDFWHHRHTVHHTPVRTAYVVTWRADGFVETKIGESTCFFVNRYNLHLKEGDLVYTHVAFIIEKVE